MGKTAYDTDFHALTREPAALRKAGADVHADSAYCFDHRDAIHPRYTGSNTE